MSDLVERLEAAARHPDNQHGPHEWLAEAAARIKALEAEVREMALQSLSVESRDEALCARIKALEEGLRQISMACDSYGEDLSFGDMLTVKRIQDQARDLLGGSNE